MQSCESLFENDDLKLLNHYSLNKDDLSSKTEFISFPNVKTENNIKILENIPNMKDKSCKPILTRHKNIDYSVVEEQNSFLPGPLSGCFKEDANLGSSLLGKDSCTAIENVSISNSSSLEDNSACTGKEASILLSLDNIESTVNPGENWCAPMCSTEDNIPIAHDNISKKEKEEIECQNSFKNNAISVDVGNIHTLDSVDCPPVSSNDKYFKKTNFKDFVHKL